MNLREHDRQLAAKARELQEQLEATQVQMQIIGTPIYVGFAQRLDHGEELRGWPWEIVLTRRWRTVWHEYAGYSNDTKKQAEERYRDTGEEMFDLYVCKGFPHHKFAPVSFAPATTIELLRLTPIADIDPEGARLLEMADTTPRTRPRPY